MVPKIFKRRLWPNKAISTGPNVDGQGRAASGVSDSRHRATPRASDQRPILAIAE